MQASSLDSLTVERIRLQNELDSERTLKERNKDGQFATPSGLAESITDSAFDYLSVDDPITLLEPSCGLGSFIAAAFSQSQDKKRPIHSVCGIELDHRFVEGARKLWSEMPVKVIEEDFLALELNEKFNLVLANPPYVRHHHLKSEQKKKYQDLARARSGINASGLSGLYVYFLLSAHSCLAPDALSAWLIPSEFFDTNYGQAIRTYLTRKVTLLRIHRFDPGDLQFDEALTTSVVVFFKNCDPRGESEVLLSEGGKLDSPTSMREVKVSDLSISKKWTAFFGQSTSLAPSCELKSPTLSDYFEIRRGIATGNNSFFILERSKAQQLGINTSMLPPVLPPPRKFIGTHILADEEGWPTNVTPLVLITSDLAIEELAKHNPGLAKYLENADEKTLNSYIVTHRSPWYKVEERPPAAFLVTYMGRSTSGKQPFRVIFNESRAIATNGYILLYPKPFLLEAVKEGRLTFSEIHDCLLSIESEEFVQNGRVYGGGLRKIEPRELGNVAVHRLGTLLPLDEELFLF